MKKKKNAKQTTKFTVQDFIKAVKKADREEELANHAGWKRQTNVHKNKKAYDRTKDKRVDLKD